MRKGRLIRRGALSFPVLGERVGWRRWTAILVGFLGALVMLRPGLQAIGPGALAAMGAALSACAGSLVAPFQYIQMLWGTLIGRVVRGDAIVVSMSADPLDPDDRLLEVDRRDRR